MYYNIKKFREEKNWTQEELSFKSGVSRTIISKLESDNDVVTTTATLKNLANALDKSISEIFYTE